MSDTRVQTQTNEFAPCKLHLYFHDHLWDIEGEAAFKEMDKRQGLF